MDNDHAFPKIRAYTPDDLGPVESVFCSNVPKYFSLAELPGLFNFLAGHADDYFVVEVGKAVVGSGGIALNEDDTVSLCWGMVRNDHIGTGLGKQLTQFRIRLANEKFPGLPIVISTSQHTEGFYERFGFRTIEHITDGFGPGIDNCKMRLDRSTAENG